jgi:hypothetical protein
MNSPFGHFESTDQQSSILAVEPQNEAIPYPGSVQKSAVALKSLLRLGIFQLQPFPKTVTFSGD